MNIFRRLLRQVAMLLLAGALIAMLIALIWTLLQIAAVEDDKQTFVGTAQARRNDYRATATALASEAGNMSLRVEGQILRMQQKSGTRIPTATPAAPTESGETAQATALPEDFSLPTMLVPRDPSEGKWLAGTRVPARAPQIRREHQLINFIFLGSDEELTDDNFIRTDTMIVVSLNTETGTVSMLSLPRDLFVYIPHGNMGRLNTAFGVGENLDWEPGGGFGLLRQTLFYNFGINIHYYARVNFSGFETIIDRLGGVDIAVDCSYRDLYPAARPQSGGAASADYRWRTLDVGYYTFDGFDALWYARTRKYTDDFDRGRRQQQLLRAIWRKARSQGLVTTVPTLWNELVEVVDTDIPFDMVLRLLPYLVNLDLSSVENHTLKKSIHTRYWTTPDGAQVLLPIADATAALMQDFYAPPSRNQVALAGPSIAVYNASGVAHWDIIAGERLRWGGYNAVSLGPLGEGESYPSNVLTDYVATEKGSLTPGILRALNMKDEQVLREPRANRQYDYQVVIGRDYESCTFGVLPFDN